MKQNVFLILFKSKSWTNFFCLHHEQNQFCPFWGRLFFEVKWRYLPIVTKNIHFVRWFFDFLLRAWQKYTWSACSIVSIFENQQKVLYHSTLIHRSEGPDKAKKNPQFHPDFVYFPYLQNATKGFNFASKICVKVTMYNLLLIFMVKLIFGAFFHWDLFTDC